MVDLIPSSDTVMQILKRTGAFREGHFVYPNGKHSPHYFQMPLAFRYYDTARVLAVALSRKFRIDRDVSETSQHAAPFLKGKRRGMHLEIERRRVIADEYLSAEVERGARRLNRKTIEEPSVGASPELAGKVSDGELGGMPDPRHLVEDERPMHRCVRERQRRVQRSKFGGDVCGAELERIAQRHARIDQFDRLDFNRPSRAGAVLLARVTLDEGAEVPATVGLL